MAITYTWDITNIRKAPQLNNMNDVIVHVRWTCTGTDENGTTGQFQGATPLPLPSGDNFTPYENLTKEQVLGWIQGIVVENYLDHVQQQIIKQITKKNDPWVDVTEAPWGGTLGTGSVTPAPGTGE